MFQFTHPVWGATPDNRIFSYEGEFQFTHPVWGATEEGTKDARGLSVSIHAPRVGCDSALGYQEIESRVSIHAPRVGCDPAFGLNL